jgi:hypothetical protein
MGERVYLNVALVDTRDILEFDPHYSPHLPPKAQNSHYEALEHKV